MDPEKRIFLHWVEVPVKLQVVLFRTVGRALDPKGFVGVDVVFPKIDRVGEEGAIMLEDLLKSRFLKEFVAVLVDMENHFRSSGLPCPFLNDVVGLAVA